MKIGFIGAGKVGTSLGHYFAQHDLPLSGYFSRSRSSSELASEFTGSDIFEDLSGLLMESSIVFITTGDDQIAGIVDLLFQSGGITEHHTIIHTSGALSTDLFESLKKTNCGLCSLHPIMSFSDIKTAAKNLNETVFTLEGNKKGLADIESILAIAGNPYFVINKDHKVLYHAAACILSNYLVTLIDSGFELLKTTGIPADQISQAFLPLIKATIGNIEKSGPVAALTGPLVRGDENTIATHLQSIKAQTPDYLDLYQTMGLATIDMIKDKRIDSEKYNQLKNLLIKDEHNEI